MPRYKKESGRRCFRVTKATRDPSKDTYLNKTAASETFLEQSGNFGNSIRELIISFVRCDNVSAII